MADDPGLRLPLAPPATENHCAAGEASPPAGLTPTTPGGSAVPLHPQKWSEEQVRAWWDKRTRRKKDIERLPRGTDGRNIMRWNQTRFEQQCNGNHSLACALYQDLRNEVQRFEQFRKTGVVPEPCRVRDADDWQRKRSKDRPPAGPKLASTMPAQAKGQFKFSPGARAGAEDARPAPGTLRRSAPGASASPAAAGRGSSTGASARMKLASRASARAALAEAQAATKADAERKAEAAARAEQETAALSGLEALDAHLDGAAVLPRQDADAIMPQDVPLEQKSPVTPPRHMLRSAMVPLDETLADAQVTHTDDFYAGEYPAHARSSSEPFAQTAPLGRRSLCMEDLGDQTLAQISSPKRQDAKDMQDLLFREAKLDSPSRVALDDTEIFRRTKTSPPRPATSANKENEEDDATRQMFNKRELRKRHKPVFEQQIRLWREKRLTESVTPGSEAAPSRVRVCVRKRPLFSHEEAAEEFDVVSVRSSTQVVVHNCLTKADLRSLFVSHMGFQFGHAFDEQTTDDEVYANCAAPAVDHMLAGSVSTLFMFGQTGSGKTHTMSGLIKRAAKHLFLVEPQNELESFSLTAFEIAGKSMRDLLGATSSPKEVKVMEDKGGRTRVIGVRSMEVSHPEELLELMATAQSNRATRATQVNETSSRSHAVYRICRQGSNGSAPATLTLVDCAGSERREDSSHHDARSRKDAAEINSTIFALKECFRVMRSAKGQPPYRDSLLTRVLSDSFSSERALIVAIGTVSPSATDTEHSVGTLRALQQLQGTQMVFDEREDVVKQKHVEIHPRTWSEAEVRRWMEGALGGRARTHAAALTKGTDGKNLVRWPMQRFTQLCSGDEDLGGKLYQELRVKIRAAGGGGA